jgi:hypothetical protein
LHVPGVLWPGVSSYTAPPCRSHTLVSVSLPHSGFSSGNYCSSSLTLSVNPMS